MVPLRLAIVAVLALRRRWLQAAAFLGAVVTSELCIGPLKALTDRPRPPDPLVDTNSASFPSGHAIAASVTALGLVVVLVPPGRRRTRWTVAAALFAAAVAMSRTYLAAHWASDVVAGAAIGTGLALVWPAALELVRARVRRRPSNGNLVTQILDIEDLGDQIGLSQRDQMRRSRHRARRRRNGRPRGRR